MVRPLGGTTLAQFVGNLPSLNSIAPPSGEATWWILGWDQNLKLCIKPSSHEKLHVILSVGRILSLVYWERRPLMSAKFIWKGMQSIASLFEPTYTYAWWTHIHHFTSVYVSVFLWLYQNTDYINPHTDSQKNSHFRNLRGPADPKNCMIWLSPPVHFAQWAHIWVLGFR